MKGRSLLPTARMVVMRSPSLRPVNVTRETSSSGGGGTDHRKSWKEYGMLHLSKGQIQSPGR